MEKMILMIGGTGLLGVPTSHCLQESGFGVRVMTRDFQKAHKIFNNSLEIFDGDPTDPSCLGEALHGCYGVHISLPTEVEREVAEMAAKLAHRLGVKRISYISGATVAEKNSWFDMVNRKFLAE